MSQNSTVMRRRSIITAVTLCTFLLTMAAWSVNTVSAHPKAARATTRNLVQYINPIIGTQGGGNTFIAADTPFGMVQLGPDVGSTLDDFSFTHLSGPGCGKNSQDLPFIPTTGANNTTPPGTFAHTGETATAGYYGVTLDNGVKTELTTTSRTGFARFTFPAGSIANVKLDASQQSNPSLQAVSNTEVTGQADNGNFCNTGNVYTFHFDAQFDQPFTVTQSATGMLLLTFNATVVQMKVGISYVSIDNAKANLQAENNGWNFDAVHSAASDSWNTRLNSIQMSGGSTDNLTKFYTALYHAMLHPNIFSDTNGQYVGFDKQVHTTSGYTQYANFSGWDVYRDQVQLLAMIAPHETSDILQSLVTDAQQCGAFPRWSQNNTDSGVMVGDPGTLFVSSGYAFGATNFDTKSALQTMLKTALQPGTRCGGVETRGGLAQYIYQGYLSDDGSVTLEFGSADFAAAQFAQALGDTTNASILQRHADNWQNIFDPSTHAIRPRHSDGSWLTPFDLSTGIDYVEGNAAQYTWMIPYNLHGIINNVGGNAAAVSRLDSYFSQLDFSNEPEFNQPWIYDWAQAPWRTQDVVRRIFDQTYSNQPAGLPGNDDLGAMSAWFVWSALGLYPEIPGVGGLAMATPLFTNTTITLGNGNTITLNAPNAPSRYIQSVTLNGTAYNRPWLDWSSLQGGATLNYTLGDNTSTWGSDANSVPPSYPVPALTSDFADSFESGQMAPIADTVDTDTGGGGSSNVTGATLETRNEITAAGSTAVMYGGQAQGASSDYAYMKGLDFSANPIPVTSSTILDYGIFPESHNPNLPGGGVPSGNNSSCVAIDLIFNDGSTLRNSNLTDQYGNGIRPSSQCGHLILDNWNEVIVKLGASFSGKSIVRLDIGYDQPNSSGGYRGYVDAIKIEHQATSTGGSSFSSGFESGDTQLTWTNTTDTNGGGGISNVGGYCCGLSNPETGPRNEIAHTGSNALMYSGKALGGSGSANYAYMQLFDVSGQALGVDSGTTLDYWIYPQSSSSGPGGGYEQDTNSTCVAIDLIFNDGSDLRDSGATDQNGNRAHPASQCGHLTLDTWNHVIVNLGSVKAGKTIVRIDLGYDQPNGSGGYRGYVDDIHISG